MQHSRAGPYADVLALADVDLEATESGISLSTFDFIHGGVISFVVRERLDELNLLFLQLSWSF